MREMQMKTYTTSEIARLLGIHPNTVRLYEAWQLIPRAQRKANGYRVFTEIHLAQLRLVRVAFRTEVLQNGLRKKMVEAVKASAQGDYDRALQLAEAYRRQVGEEITNAAEAIRVARRIHAGATRHEDLCLTRREIAARLGVSLDTLRNWERNGLLRPGRMQNGLRVHDGGDLDRLMMIRALRCASYSLEAILRMLTALERDPKADMAQALNVPGEGAEIISVCDRLITSLRAAERNAAIMTGMLADMRREFANPP